MDSLRKLRLKGCWCVSLPQNPIAYPQNGRMAGRPRKDPSGQDLVPFRMKSPVLIKEVARRKAKAKGKNLTEYVLGLILADNPELAELMALQKYDSDKALALLEQLQLDPVQLDMLQEVLPLRKTA